MVMRTEAIDAGVSNVIRLLGGREIWLVPALMILFSLGGTSFGMWEETMAFYPLLVPVFVSAGYDALTGVAVVLLGSGAGVLASTVNPFATGIAAGFAGVSLGDGLGLRLLMLVVFDAVAIWYVNPVRGEGPAGPVPVPGGGHQLPAWRGGAEGRRAPGPDGAAEGGAGGVHPNLSGDDLRRHPLRRHGPAHPALGWWFPELSGLFLLAGILAGLIYGMGELEIVEAFVAGAADLIGVALHHRHQPGHHRADGRGADHRHGALLGGAGPGGGRVRGVHPAGVPHLPAPVHPDPLLLRAGHPVHPRHGPPGPVRGIDESLVVTAFQSASGLVNLITPTAAVVMGGLAFGRVPYDRWVRFVWKLILIFLLLCLGFLAVSAVL